MVKYIDVEIEIQNEVEWTSEEEIQEGYSSIKSIKMLNSIKKDKYGKSKTHHGTSLLGDGSDAPKEIVKDHLVNFEKEMNIKFRHQRTLRQAKSGDMPTTPIKSPKSKNGVTNSGILSHKSSIMK